jgi:TM2 domain-containing membrane protein YozV
MTSTLYGADLFSAESARDDITIRLRYNARKKSAWLGVGLLVVLGCLGIHRFYAGRMGSGVMLLFLTAMSVVSAGTWLSTIGFGMVAAWCLADMFLLPMAINDYNKRLMISLGY